METERPIHLSSLRIHHPGLNLSPSNDYAPSTVLAGMIIRTRMPSVLLVRGARGPSGQGGNPAMASTSASVPVRGLGPQMAAWTLLYQTYTAIFKTMERA